MEFAMDGLLHNVFEIAEKSISLAKFKEKAKQL